MVPLSPNSGGLARLVSIAGLTCNLSQVFIGAIELPFQAAYFSEAM